MRSWVFRNRDRLAALLGRPPLAAPPRALPADASGATSRPAARHAAPGAAGPRVIVLQPARRAR